MPTQDFGVYPDSLTAGTQVSSTYEGRHITIREDEVIHAPNNTLIIRACCQVTCEECGEVYKPARLLKEKVEE